MAASVTKIAYQTMQQGKSLLGIAHKQVSTQLMDLVAPKANAETIPIRAETLQALRTSMDYLLERDWQEAEQGLYPTSQLFDAPWLDWMLRYPLVWLDLPNIWNRRLRRDVRDLPNNVDISNFPDYYLQNFHHQTDGYLSDRSAELYDLQVELLFNGTADAMRRRILKPLKERLSRANLASGALRILDVASGTGRTLRQLRGAFSSAQLVGLDLSNAYLRQANRWLSQLPGELPQLVQGNAEALPFQNESMQAVSCVFLLHELPAEAREAVLAEAFRVLVPGGVLVLADSVQLADSPQFQPVMENFRRVFHEPYYRDYIGDQIETRLSRVGFTEVKGETWFMTRIWCASKPDIG